MTSTENYPGLSYPVTVGAGAFGGLREVLKSQGIERWVLVTEHCIASLYPHVLDQSGVPPAFRTIVTGGERCKNIETVSSLWASFLQQRVDRQTAVVVVGGGALCDAAGFASATFMRGCPCVLVPTTLLAQVDASIGGKTAINLSGLKNVIGSTSHPRAVFIDTNFLTSLPDRQICSGMAEILKHGLIADAAFVAELAAQPQGSVQSLPALLSRSVAIKANIVSQDPLDQGLRRVLNFGHTVGHALEALALEDGSELPHGEAVALGMVAESWISHKHEWLTSQDLRSIEEALSRVGLPTRVPQPVSFDRAVEKMRLDKKTQAGIIHCTLLRRIGCAEYDCPVDEAAIRESLVYLCERR